MFHSAYSGSTYAHLAGKKIRIKWIKFENRMPSLVRASQGVFSRKFPLAKTSSYLVSWRPSCTNSLESLAFTYHSITLKQMVLWCILITHSSPCSTHFHWARENANESLDWKRVEKWGPTKGVLDLRQFNKSLFIGTLISFCYAVCNLCKWIK